MLYISWQLGIFKSLFTLTLSLLLSKNRELLSLENTFSLGIDLVRVFFYPSAFVKSVLIVEGFVLIRKVWSLEHFGFGLLLHLSFEFEVGILLVLLQCFVYR